VEEVRVPGGVAWEEADPPIQPPGSQWGQWGLALADGRPLPADSLPASLLLPMGRFGPAFLAYPNFQAFLGWNSAFVYATTAAYLATRLAGAPPIHRGSGTVVPLSTSQMLELQQLLARRGYLSGQVDGKLGLTTRAAVRQAQVKLGMPADSYPTIELIHRLRGL